jgi:hypothetical protein
MANASDEILAGPLIRVCTPPICGGAGFLAAEATFDAQKSSPQRS